MNYSIKRYSTVATTIHKLKNLVPNSIPSYNHTDITLKKLLSANLHLGHSKSKWDQNMLPYLYGHRDGIHIINLEHTLIHLRRAARVVNEVARKGGNIVFVGTKPSLHKLVVDVAQQSNAFYVIHWLGGLFTNKERVLRRSVGYDPDKVSQTLIPQSTMDLVKESQEEILEIIQKQPYVHQPDLLILLDYPNTAWAVHEANLAKCPVIALCDTDCDPSRVQYPIPGNDDSFAGVELVARVLGEASREGYSHYKNKT